MVAKRIKGLLVGLSSSSRHSGGSTLAESDMLGHADTNDGEMSHQHRRFWLLTQELGQDLPINCTSAQGEDDNSLLLDNARNLPDYDIRTGKHKLYRSCFKIFSNFWVWSYRLPSLNCHKCLVLGQKKGLKNQMICGHWKSSGAVLAHHYQLVEDNAVILLTELGKLANLID